MLIAKTHFEQIPLKIAAKIAEDEAVRNESAIGSLLVPATSRTAPDTGTPRAGMALRNRKKVRA